jgi:hypothetical protein
LTELQGPEVLKLLIIADELGIHLLISCIQNHLIKYQDEFLQQNPIGILEIVINMNRSQIYGIIILRKFVKILTYYLNLIILPA